MLFEIELKYVNGVGKAYFYDERHTTFIKEKEYLLAGVGFGVTGVKKRVETYKGK